MSKRGRFRVPIGALGALVSLILGAGTVLASTPGADVRLTNDALSTTGYVSADDIAGLTHYTDATLDECSRSRGRENEPAIAIDPRNSNVMVGSSNDYCAVYNDGDDAEGAPIPSGPIWLGYYRSENGGSSFQSSLVPGYPGDTSQLGALAKIRTASSGDPVLAWDADGRLFMGSESSDDPSGSGKGWGDVWVGRYVNPNGPGGNPADDGKRFAGSVIVERGSSDPFYIGKFNDKTSIEADRTNTTCRGNVYFAWSRYNGSGTNSIYFSRSTNHGATFSRPIKLSAGTVNEVQFPDISVTSNGHVYVTFRQMGRNRQADAIDIVKSTNCGKTFSAVKVLQKFAPMGLVDVKTDGSRARDCGLGAEECESGFTFFRADSGPRSTSDQAAADEFVHIAYEAIVPGSEAPTGTTFGWADGVGKGGLSSIYYLRYNGADATKTAPERVAVSTGQQLFPDLAVDNGTVHALFYDSRNDANNTPASALIRPIGNSATGQVGAGFDVYAATRPTGAGSWSGAQRLTDVTSNGQYMQFAGRTVPFGGDYLWIDSKLGLTYGVWTDWRNTVAGNDPRFAGNNGAEVLQCRTQHTDGSWTGDTCPRDGGLDQDIYGDLAP